jgi:hypothetical protein
MLAFIKDYAKALAAVGAAALGALAAALTGDNHIDVSEWSNVILMTAGAAAVLAAPNVPGARYTKAVVAVVVALAAPAALSLVTDGISWTDVWQLAAAALGALGVVSMPGPVLLRWAPE